MIKTLSTRTLFTLGFLILIASNVFVISRVAGNRTGPYETMIELTERELSLPYSMHEENSGMSLQLQWRTMGKNTNDYYDNYHYNSPAWLDEEKLKSLGFTIDKISDSSERRKRPVPRQAFIALEYQGEPYQESLRRCEKKFEAAQSALQTNAGNEKLRQEFKSAETQLQSEHTTASRLFAVDAGLRPEMLRKKYPDRSRFIIAAGVVEQNWNYENKKAIPEGDISNLMVERIHVPLEFRKIFDEILSEKRSGDAKSPRYKVQIAYGSRFEPWMRAVTKMPDDKR